MEAAAKTRRRRGPRNRKKLASIVGHVTCARGTHEASCNHYYAPNQYPTFPTASFLVFLFFVLKLVIAYAGRARNFLVRALVREGVAALVVPIVHGV